MNEVAWDGKPVKRKCSSCGSLDWYEIRTMMEGTQVYDWCSNCPEPVKGIEGVPDAFMPRLGMTFEALCDTMGKPVPIQSKRHKQEVMDQLGVRECPERLKGNSWVDGTRNYRKRQFEKDRPMIRENYRRYLEHA